jgi:hypothetical protein
MAIRSALKKIRLDTFSLNYESRVVIENVFVLHFWGAHAARVYCSAARRTASWKCAAFDRLPLKFVIHHALEFSASGRKLHASGVRSPDSYPFTRASCENAERTD